MLTLPGVGVLGSSAAAPPGPGPGGLHPPPGVQVLGLKILSNSPKWHLPHSFLGMNVLPYASVSSKISGYVNGTQLQLVRWPGGSVGDDLNYTTNLITRPGGSSYTPPFNTSEFISWCRSVGCRADFELPGEINSSATAAYYVNYVENTLGFHPRFWEVGNEPALWAHYNQPWSNWASKTISKITPTAYADLVHRYIAAIRVVDPQARILGLPGVGTGAYREPTWIADSVAVNGHNLSGVGIHVYPAGFVNDVHGNLTQFFHSLLSHGSIAGRVPLDHKAIISACRSCRHMPIYATEVGSASDLGGKIQGNYGTFMSTYPQVPYIAALAVQGMLNRVSGLEFYSLEALYPGAIFNSSSGNFSPYATLFSKVLPHVDPWVLPVQVTGAAGGSFLALARNAPSTSYSVLIANTNLTMGERIPLNGTGVLTTGVGEIWRWNSTSAGPVTSYWLGGTPSSFWVPPESVVLVKVATLLSLL